MINLMATVNENIKSIADDINRLQQKHGEFECDLILNTGEGERVTYRFKSAGLLKILITVINHNAERSRSTGDDGGGVTRSPEDAL